MTSSEQDAVFTEVRPWGSFSQFLTNSVGTVKVITVKPSCRLSLQQHKFRDELWHVIDGPVDVTVAKTTWQAPQGSLIWIPRHTAHRLGNSMSNTARILEIAFGVFDEHDIERLEDDFYRIQN